MKKVIIVILAVIALIFMVKSRFEEERVSLDYEMDLNPNRAGSFVDNNLAANLTSFKNFSLKDSLSFSYYRASSDSFEIAKKVINFADSLNYSFPKDRYKERKLYLKFSFYAKDTLATIIINSDQIKKKIAKYSKGSSWTDVFLDLGKYRKLSYLTIKVNDRSIYLTKPEFYLAAGKRTIYKTALSFDYKNMPNNLLRDSLAFNLNGLATHSFNFNKICLPYEDLYANLYSMISSREIVSQNKQIKSYLENYVKKNNFLLDLKKEGYKIIYLGSDSSLVSYLKEFDFDEIYLQKLGKDSDIRIFEKLIQLLGKKTTENSLYFVQINNFTFSNKELNKQLLQRTNLLFGKLDEEIQKKLAHSNYFLSFFAGTNLQKSFLGRGFIKNYQEQSGQDFQQKVIPIGDFFKLFLGFFSENKNLERYKQNFLKAKELKEQIPFVIHRIDKRGILLGDTIYFRHVQNQQEELFLLTNNGLESLNFENSAFKTLVRMRKVYQKSFKNGFVKKITLCNRSKQSLSYDFKVTSNNKFSLIDSTNLTASLKKKYAKVYFREFLKEVAPDSTLVILFFYQQKNQKFNFDFKHKRKIVFGNQAIMKQVGSKEVFKNLSSIKYLNQEPVFEFNSDYDVKIEDFYIE